MCRGCQYCAGASQEEQAAFAYHTVEVYSWPLTSEANGFICYRQSVPDTSCDALTPMVTCTLTPQAYILPLTSATRF